MKQQLHHQPSGKPTLDLFHLVVSSVKHFEQFRLYEPEKCLVNHDSSSLKIQSMHSYISDSHSLNQSENDAYGYRNRDVLYVQSISPFYLTFLLGGIGEGTGSGFFLKIPGTIICYPPANGCSRHILR